MMLWLAYGLVVLILLMIAGLFAIVWEDRRTWRRAMRAGRFDDTAESIRRVEERQR